MMKQLVISLIAFPFLVGAIPIQQSASEKLNRYIQRGVFVGGYDSGIQKLKHLRTYYDKSTQMERMVMEFGAKRPGFFHISVQKEPLRLLISLENIGENKLSHKKVEKIFSKSEFFEPPRMFFDSDRKTLTFEVGLKKQAKVEVFELPGFKKSSRIVVDVK